MFLDHYKSTREQELMDLLNIQEQNIGTTCS